jgi:hypothetical protein
MSWSQPPRLLKRTRKGALDVTQWQDWFLSCLHRATEGSQGTLNVGVEKKMLKSLRLMLT